MKKKRLISLIAAFSLVFTGVTAYVPSGVYAEENVQMENLVQGKAAIASSTANGYGPEYAVDGVTSETVQWNSADMKNWGAASGNSKDSEEQTAQWIQIDRGENAEEEDISSIKLWYNVKVWPMEYEIYTADESTLTEGSTDVDLNNWTSLVSVSRPSANGQVANGEGQNIADTSANTDTITAASSPALASDKKLKRYVLMYIRKVNAQAVGNNVNLREIQIFSQNESADVNGTLAGITADSLKVQDGQITVDTGTARGVNAYVRGSSLENVVSNDGQISDYNIGDRNVTLLVRVENKKNPDEYAEKNIEVTIPDHSGNYPEGNFPEVSAPNEKAEVIPSLQEWYGYEGDFELTESSKIIYNDTADAGIREAAWNMQEDLKEIAGLDLTVEEGNAPASSNDIYIESQTDDTYGVGDEGYLLKTDDEGVHIYAPTYTGCLYGTITVEQILDQAEDNRTVPKGITRDYPAYEVRGIMLDVARTPYRLSQLQDYAKIMLWYKMNEYHLHINDNDNCNTAFASNETHAGFHRLESDEFPSLTSEVKHAGIPSNFVNEDYYLNNADYQGNPTYTKEEWKELQQKQKLLYILFILCVPLIIVLLSNKMAQYSRYFSDLSINIGLIVPVKLALWMLCMLLMAHSAMYQEFLSSIHASEKFDVRISYIIYLFGLLLVSLGYFFPTFIERISWYFYVYEGVFYGALLKNTERGTKIPISCGIFLLIAYGFWYSLSHDSQGVMPYLFII